jgi:hypothetical protein
VKTRAQDEVEVLNAEGHSVEFISPALARIAVARGVASVPNTAALRHTIQLKRGYTKCPKSFSDGNKMNYQNKAIILQSIENYFRENDPAKGGSGVVWVQVTSMARKVATQIMIECSNSRGDVTSLAPIKGRDPVCLTNEARFDDLYNSKDLRNFLQKGVLRLLSQEEAYDYAVKKDEFMSQFMSANARPEDFEAPQTSPNGFGQTSYPMATTNAQYFGRTAAQMPNAGQSSMYGQATVGRASNAVDPHVYAMMFEDSPINPRVQHLIAGVMPNVDANERFPERFVLDELQQIEDIIGIEDCQLLVARGFYPTVRSWANKKMLELQAELAFAQQREFEATQAAQVAQAQAALGIPVRQGGVGQTAQVVAPPAPDASLGSEPGTFGVPSPRPR